MKLKKKYSGTGFSGKSNIIQLFSFSHLLLIIFIYFITAGIVAAQWARLNGPYGGSISGITCRENIIVIYSDIKGMLLSADNGQNWKTINNGLPQSGINRLEIKGDTIMAAMRGNGLYITTDYGNKWTNITDGIRQGLNINDFIEHKNNLFVATYALGLFRSDNHGSTWSKLVNGLPESTITSIAANDKKIVVSTWNGIYISFNGGLSWTAGTSLPYSSWVDKVFVKDDRIFASNYNFGVFISSDNGVTWKDGNNGLPKSPYVYCISYFDSTVFAGLFYGSGFYKSTDNGSHWQTVKIGHLEKIPVYDIEVSGRNILTGTGGSGVFISADSGSTWKALNNGIDGLYISSLRAKGDSLFAGTNYGRIFLSMDHGLNWKAVHESGDFNLYIGLLAFYDKYIFASSSYGLLRSEDNGLNWEMIDNGILHSGISSFIIHKNKLFATVSSSPGLKGSLYCSEDYGTQWFKITSGLPDDRAINSITTGGKTLFVICEGNVYLSDNDGKTWEIIKDGLDGKKIYLIKAQQNTVFAASADSSIFRSTDAGKNWQQVSNGLNKNTYSNFEFADTNIVFALAHYDGIYYSQDNGLNWGKITSNLPEKNVRALSTDSEYIYAGLLTTVWRRKLSEIISPNTAVYDNSPSRIHPEYYLDQNYPNPFNPVTVIRYALPENNYVELKIYDILGREIAELVNKEQLAGEYTIRFDGSALPSGIYIYTIKAGQYMSSRKLILLK
ncbi:MAG: VPS10 domain-containing protein [Syntrophothermus sp.]